MEKTSRTGHRSAMEQARKLRIHLTKDHSTDLDIRLDSTPLSCDFGDTWIDACVPGSIVSGSVLTIFCCTGKATIGHIQFDHVWTPNVRFQNLFPTLWTKIQTNQYNLEDLQDHELRYIETVGLFVPSGAGKFDGWEDLRINPRINGVIMCHSPGYRFPPHQVFAIQAGDQFACDLTIPEFVS